MDTKSKIFDYQYLLDRAYKLLPEKTKKDERWEPPKFECEIIGRKQTVIKNFGQVAKQLRRDIKQLSKFMSQELGVPCNLEKDKLKIKGRFSEIQINRILMRYIKLYVICPICGKPDTKITTLRGHKILKCEACGAISPLPQ
jgi:translation initiation factor 2 subunit 2